MQIVNCEQSWWTGYPRLILFRFNSSLFTFWHVILLNWSSKKIYLHSSYFPLISFIIIVFLEKKNPTNDRFLVFTKKKKKKSKVQCLGTDWPPCGPHCSVTGRCIWTINCAAQQRKQGDTSVKKGAILRVKIFAYLYRGGGSCRRGGVKPNDARLKKPS